MLHYVHSSLIYNSQKLERTQMSLIRGMDTALNKEFLHKEIQMAEKHLENCSTSLVIREMQIKTTLRFHPTTVRMAKIKNSWASRCWQGCGERGILLYCWWDCKKVQPLWKSVWRFLRKPNVTLREDPAIPLLGIYPEDFPACNKDICSTIFIAALFIIARCWKEPRCPSTEEWMQKIWHIYTMEYYLAIKKTMTSWNS